MKVKVEVPATANRKAYSYFREGREKDASSKSQGVSKRAVAGVVGGAAVLGLTALAASRKNKGGSDTASDLRNSVSRESAQRVPFAQRKEESGLELKGEGDQKSRNEEKKQKAEERAKKQKERSAETEKKIDVEEAKILGEWRDSYEKDLASYQEKVSEIALPPKFIEDAKNRGIDQASFDLAGKTKDTFKNQGSNDLEILLTAKKNGYEIPEDVDNFLSQTAKPTPSEWNDFSRSSGGKYAGYSNINNDKQTRIKELVFGQKDGLPDKKPLSIDERVSAFSPLRELSDQLVASRFKSLPDEDFQKLSKLDSSEGRREVKNGVYEATDTDLRKGIEENLRKAGLKGNEAKAAAQSILSDFEAVRASSNADLYGFTDRRMLRPSLGITIGLKDAFKNLQEDWDAGFEEFKTKFGVGDKKSRGKTSSAKPWNEVLGISDQASEKEAKKAYISLAKKNHPDLFESEQDKTKQTEVMQQINAAMEDFYRSSKKTNKDSYRTDAKVKVDVPATANRKAYSYFREGNESGGQKVPSVNKKAVALGAIALGGLAAGGLAIAKKNKQQVTEAASKKTKKALEDLEAKDKEMSEAQAKNLKGLEDMSESVKDIGKNSPFAGMSMDELQKAREEVTNAREAVQDFSKQRRAKKEAPAEPFIDIESEVVRDEVQQISEPPKQRSQQSLPPPKVSTGGATVSVSESSKSKDKVVTSDQGKGVGAIVGKVKDLWDSGWDRDYKARGVSSLKDKEYDLNEITYKAGQGTRSALNGLVNLAGSFVSVFAPDNNTVNVKPIPSSFNKERSKKTRRPNMTKNKVWNSVSRRYESLSERIDSFAEKLREDAKCASGNKPCGKICLPQGKSCVAETAKAFGGGAAQSLGGVVGSGTYRALRSQGRSRGTSIAGAVGANLAVGAAAIAGGAAILKNRENKALDDKYDIDEAVKRSKKNYPKLKDSEIKGFTREIARVMETPKKGNVFKRIADIDKKMKKLEESRK